MTDPVYSGDFFLDQRVTVKQEIMDTNQCVTASMPIPPRKMMDLSEMRDFGFDFIDVSGTSPSVSNDIGTSHVPVELQGSSGLFLEQTLWSNRIPEPNKGIAFRMDDEDIFQVDKADLIQGPTLAELNANDENLLEDLSFDDILLPDENSYYISVPPYVKYQNIANTPAVQINNSVCSSQSTDTFSPSSYPPLSLGYYKESYGTPTSIPSSPLDQSYGGTVISDSMIAHNEVLSPPSQHSSHSSLLHHSGASSVTSPSFGLSPIQQKHSSLHELLLRKEKFSASPDGQLMGQSVPGRTGHLDIAGSVSRHGKTMTMSSRLSSSAPTHLGLEQIWQRREPRPHLLSTSSLAEAGSTSSISTGGVLSPESHDFSHDEGFDTDEDSDHYEDFSSDGESVSDGESPSKPSGSKRERYFWQYNVQAKGPKGHRLVLKTRLEDPHVLNEATDPVFSPECSVQGIKHSGKARKGDGNDLTPNPRKLVSIGRELDKLSQIINDMTPVSELPFNVRPKTRKEKNKLASRACRLKKKAQHEANKLKLHGLEQEHKRLNNGISQLKQVIVVKFTADADDSSTQEELTNKIDRIAKSATKLKIAGHTTEFVNKVIEKVKGGVAGGGLEDL